MTATMARPPGLRRGDVLPSHGYARCFGCHKPWYAADEPVMVEYTATSAQMAMGLGCWMRATIEERVEAHRWVCDEWARMHAEDGLNPEEPPIPEITRRIEAAIRVDQQQWATTSRGRELRIVGGDQL